MKTIRQLDYMGGIVKVDEIKEINFNETGDIIDTLSGISLKDTPRRKGSSKIYWDSSDRLWLSKGKYCKRGSGSARFKNFIID